jgi:hypothetical protein
VTHPTRSEKITVIWTDSKGVEHLSEAAALQAERQYLRDSLRAMLQEHCLYQTPHGTTLFLDALMARYEIYPKE